MACSPYNFRFIQDDPLKIIRVLWPGTKFSTEQEQILYSIWFNTETFVKAANMMGKDYIASYAVVAGFLTRWPCHIITTSAGAGHLVVLWAEIHNRINSSRIPLRAEQGGPLFVNQMEIWGKYELNPKNDVDRNSYILGRVASDENMAGMGGHHIPEDPRWLWRTMCVGDEASGVKNEFIDTVRKWRHRLYLFGNTWDCDNYFRWGFEGRPGYEDKGGDIVRPNGKGYIRKLFSLPVETSPNIRFARAQIAAGKEPTGEIIIPGIKSWDKYQEELADPSWDEQQRCVAHKAEWYKGAAIKLFPQEWLNRAVEIGRSLRGCSRTAKAMGVDPAEGGDKTCVCIIDEYGIIELISEKTPDTADVTDLVMQKIDQYRLDPKKCFFDSGGGGKQHVDRLHRLGYPVMAVAFGESVVREPKRAKILYPEKVDLKEDKGAYTNRRAMMYGEAAILLDPIKKPVREVEVDFFGDDENGDFRILDTKRIKVENVQAFGIPPDGPQYGELIRQLAAMPKRYVEGKLYLPPKSRKSDSITSKSEKTLAELLGRSPDEADSFVLAVYAMTGKRQGAVLRGMTA